MGKSKWSIKKLGYSSNPWRLVDEKGSEIYTPRTLDHPDLGKTCVDMPVCGKTKQDVVDQVLEAFVRLRDDSTKKTLALRIIRTWAKCDETSPYTRSRIMADIAGRCDSVLSTKQGQQRS